MLTHTVCARQRQRSLFWHRNHTVSILPVISQCLTWITPIGAYLVPYCQSRVCSSAPLDLDLNVASSRKPPLPFRTEVGGCPLASWPCSFCSVPHRAVTDSATWLDSDLLEYRHCFTHLMSRACLPREYWCSGSAPITANTKHTGYWTTTTTFMNLDPTIFWGKFLKDEISVSYTTCSMNRNMRHKLIQVIQVSSLLEKQNPPKASFRFFFLPDL